MIKSNYKHWASDTRPRTPDLEHRTSDTRPRTPDLDHCTSDTRPRTPDLEHWTSDTRPRTPDLDHWTSDTRPRTPDIEHCTSDTRPRTPDLGHPTSNIGPRTFRPKRLIYILAIALITASCSTTTFNTKEDLWSFLKNPENEYLHSKTVNGVDFSIVYKPTDLLVEQELIGEVTANKVDSLRDKYNKYLYFNLSMAKNNQELLSNVAGNKQQFGAMVNQLAFGMDQKVHFYTPQKDTVALADYIYPRMYGMSGATTILLVYPRETMVTNGKYMTLTIEDLGFYTGEVKFKIPTKIFKNELKLKFE